MQGVEHDLGIGMAVKADTLALQFVAQGKEVVDLAVVGDHALAVRRAHGLMPAWTEVEDAEPRVSQPQRPLYPDSAVVGAAVQDAVQHGPEYRLVGRHIAFRKADDAAHQRISGITTKPDGLSQHVCMLMHPLLTLRLPMLSESGVCAQFGLIC